MVTPLAYQPHHGNRLSYLYRIKLAGVSLLNLLLIRFQLQTIGDTEIKVIESVGTTTKQVNSAQGDRRLSGGLPPLVIIRLIAPNAPVSKPPIESTEQRREAR